MHNYKDKFFQSDKITMNVCVFLKLNSNLEVLIKLKET